MQLSLRINERKNRSTEITKMERKIKKENKEIKWHENVSKKRISELGR